MIGVFAMHGILFVALTSIYDCVHHVLRPYALPPLVCVGRLRSFLASTAFEILSMSVSRTSPDPEITSDRIT
jgi:hypothetical protein